MSDPIAHFAICDDEARLAAFHSNIDPLFQRLLAEKLELAHYGSVTRSADNWSIDLIVWAREEMAKAQDQREKRWEDKIAFVLGALTHRSADRLMKPITVSKESKFYQDIFTFKVIYASGHDLSSPFTPEMVTWNPAMDWEKKFEDYFRLFWGRSLIAMHTFNSDKNNIHPWLNAFLEARQTFHNDLREYAKIAAEWNPKKVKEFLIDTHFYDERDPLIFLARRVQRGYHTTSTELLDAINHTDDSQSCYARALKKGLNYLVAATALFRNEISVDKAKQLFEIGVPEYGLKNRRPA